MSSTTVTQQRSGFSLTEYATCLNGIVWREALRFLHQRERFVSALVRPLVWLFIFAVGFRQVLGVSIIPPYETYILYEVYIAPGLMAMIQLFRSDTGEPLAVMDGRLITEMRTAAVSAVAVDCLATRDVRSLGILGSGVQSRSHVKALARVRQFEEIRVWSRSEEHTIVNIFGWSLGGFIVAMIIVIVGLLAGGPVGRFKVSATRDGATLEADSE